MSSLTKRIVNPVTHGGSARWCEDGLSQIDLVRGLIIGFAAGTLWWVYAYFGLLGKLYDRLYASSVGTQAEIKQEVRRVATPYKDDAHCIAKHFFTLKIMFFAFM